MTRTHTTRWGDGLGWTWQALDGRLVVDWCPTRLAARRRLVVYTRRNR